MAKKAGRPSKYTDEIAAMICFRLMEGETLRQICRDETLPTRRTIHNWLNSNDAFFHQYAHAKEIQADNMFDEILAIADLSSSDYRVDEYGNEKPDHEHIQRSKLRIDARKWYLSKVLPKKYGDSKEEQGALAAQIPDPDEIDLPGAIEAIKKITAE